MNFADKFFTKQAERLGMVETINLLSEGEYPIPVKAIVTRNSRSSVNFKGFESKFYLVEIMVRNDSDIFIPVVKQTKFSLKIGITLKTVTVQEVLPQSDDYLLHLGCV